MNTSSNESALTVLLFICNQKQQDPVIRFEFPLSVQFNSAFCVIKSFSGVF